MITSNILKKESKKFNINIIQLYKIIKIMVSILSKGGKILFILSNNTQYNLNLNNSLIKYIIKSDNFYFINTWIPGFLTNLSQYTKILNKNNVTQLIQFQGIKNIKKLPDLIFFFNDNTTEINLILKEVINLKIPFCGFVPMNYKNNNINFLFNLKKLNKKTIIFIYLILEQILKINKK
jgi:ribosomal protein S2